jgi:acetolactate synthase I/II/III large subunit
MMEHDGTPQRHYDLLVSAFLQEGVDTCFALLGDANMYWASRLAERGCRFVHVRHEHCAVAAAMAWARVTGRIGVASVTCGPGLTQTMTALPAAVMARIPLVVFAGEPPLKAAWYNQMIEQAPFVVATGADYHRLHTPERMAEAVRDAFVQAAEERRPVVLGVPMDLQDRPLPEGATLPRAAREILARKAPIAPHPEDLSRALDLVGRARRIVVLGGLGATAPAAVTAARSFAARCDAVLATTLPARGLYRDDPFHVGIAGGLATPVGADVLREADLVIAVGASLAHHTSMGGKIWPRATVFRIDADPATLSQGRVAADVTMRADATLALDALASAAPARSPEYRSEALACRLREASPFASVPAHGKAGPHDPRAAVAALDGAIPKDWFLVNTSGHISFFTTQMPGRPHDRFLTIREFGAIGNGTSFAMGVAAARPDQPVVLLDGDGSLMMHVQELETMARCRMKVLVVALNDGAYGSEIHKLRARGVTDEGAVFGRPDLAAVARGFGLLADELRDLDDLPAFVGRFGAGAGPALLNVAIDDRVVAAQMAARAGAIH